MNNGFRRFLFVLVLVTCFLTGTAMAADIVDSGTCGDNVSWELGDTGILIISGSGEMYDYVRTTTPWYSKRNTIQAVQINFGITHIGKNAFANCLLTSLTLPESVMSIGEDAFFGSRTEAVHMDSIESWFTISYANDGSHPNYDSTLGCRLYLGGAELTNITVPDGITDIGSHAFRHCINLSRITIGKDAASIQSNAFYDCPNLNTINVAEGNTHFCTVSGVLLNAALTKVILCPRTRIGHYSILGSVTDIDNYAFQGCSKLTSVMIPEGVASIGIYAFAGCSGLTSITIPEGVASIGSSAFLNCSGLTSVMIPDSVTSLGSRAFDGCSKLTGVIIPGSLRFIDYGVFSGCISLETVALGNGITNIDNYAFSNCGTIKAVTIPGSISYMYEYAFYGSSLTQIYFEGPETAWHSVSRGVRLDYQNILYYDGTDGSITWHLSSYAGTLTLSGSGAMPNYTANTAPWGNQIQQAVIGDGITTIGSCAFYDCRDLTEILIPNQVTEIGNLAFYGCYGLKSITIPESVTSIQNSAFQNCVITDIHIASIGSWLGIQFGNTDSHPNRVNTCHLYIGDTECQDLTIPDGITGIGSYAFCGCAYLTGVAIPESVTRIGPYAFYHCGGLADIQIPDQVTKIGDYAFSGCSALTSVAVPDSVSGVGKGAFFGCTGLADADGFIIVRDVLYRYIGNAEKVVIPRNVIRLDVSAFSGRSTMTEITIPSGVTMIEEDAFLFCSRLTDVFYRGTQSQWSAIQISQRGNQKLTSAVRHYVPHTLTLPADLLCIESGAFTNLSEVDAIRIPPQVTQIADDAFDPGMTLIIPAGSPWADWAGTHGYLTITE